MFRVLVSDKMSSDGLKPLMEADFIEIVEKNVAEAEDELHTFDALLVRSATKVTEELFKKMTSLKIVARAGVGVDNIDIDEATKHGVIVVNAPNGNTISTAEHTFAMFSALMRHIPQANISVKSRSGIVRLTSVQSFTEKHSASSEWAALEAKSRAAQKRSA
ncbi:hypothetical protein QKW55_08570 [Bacillus paralicheniformis]|nr:hypothetical protein QKW55_08570 [Bacillus paralicheniformis]